MTLEITGWGENVQIMLLDDIGPKRRFWAKNTELGFLGEFMAEPSYEALKALLPPPVIYGRWAHLHPLATGKDEQS